MVIVMAGTGISSHHSQCEWMIPNNNTKPAALVAATEKKTNGDTVETTSRLLILAILARRRDRLPRRCRQGSPGRRSPGEGEVESSFMLKRDPKRSFCRQWPSPKA